MEVGKLKTHRTPVFYFVLDPSCPDNPSASRLQHYFVTTEVDSYVEAFYFLTRALCIPPTDSALRRWHTLYSRVFGTVTFDAFMRSVQTVPVKHFHLDTTEAAARARLSEREGSPHADPNMKESTLMLHPVRQDLDPATQSVELQRLKAELGQVSGLLRIEQSKQKVQSLEDAERNALLYKLEVAHKELDELRLSSKEGMEKMRQQLRSLQDRMESLVDQHEKTIREMTLSERTHIASCEEEFLTREADMQSQFEAAVKERDRKLHRANDRILTLEHQLEDLARHLESERAEKAQLALTISTIKKEQSHESEQFKRLKMSYEVMESQTLELERACKRFEEEQRRSEGEISKYRAELARCRHEAERYAQFTMSLAGELKDLDSTSATAAEVLRKKVLRERSMNGR
jgi:DNA repair exonuclease SbcCD ATPase subunit